MAKNKANITSIERDNAYEKFLKDLSIYNVRLVKSSSSFDTAADARLRLGKKPEPVRKIISADYELGDIGEDYFDAKVNFKLTIESKKTSAKPVSVECSFEGHFHNKSPIDKKLAQRFTQSDLRLVVWPYLRQFVQDMTVRMSIPPIVLPFLTRQSD